MIVGVGPSDSERSLRGVSVVVPTRDRPQSLARCLDALERQSDVDSLEIIVVDDGSVQKGPVAETVAASPRARLLRRAHAGPAAARNAGVSEARQPFVLFLDDDCEAEEMWAAELAAVLERGADVAAGSSMNARPDDALTSASQTVVDFVRAESAGAYGGPAFVPSNNLACRREVALAVPFDEAYGPLPGGEDRDWCARVHAAGYSVVPALSAVVLHRQELMLGSFWRKHVDYGRGSYRYRRAWSRRLESPRYYGRLLRAGFANGFSTGCCVLLAQAATAIGYAREMLVRDRRA